MEAESGDLAGSIAVRLRRFSTGHIGYWIAREARGRGVATEALAGLCRWAVDTLDVKRLELLTDVDNRGSQRVAEKAGFQREGILRSSLENRDGHVRDSVMFSLLPRGTRLGGLELRPPFRVDPAQAQHALAQRRCVTNIAARPSSANGFTV